MEEKWQLAGVTIRCFKCLSVRWSLDINFWSHNVYASFPNILRWKSSKYKQVERIIEQVPWTQSYTLGLNIFHTRVPLRSLYLSIPFVFWGILNPVPAAADLSLNSAYTVLYFAFSWVLIHFNISLRGFFWEVGVLTLCLSQNLSDFLPQFLHFPPF